ncbi:hypothetical protein V12B01_18926 [Vibrio splendidus 12B01]|nr:hypothetical protein V12B01_18926 [Vibrio splendidus 12B01]
MEFDGDESTLALFLGEVFHLCLFVYKVHQP